MTDHKSSIVTSQSSMLNMPTHFESLYPAGSRYKTIDELLRFVKEGNSAQLVGLPGVGRANIFRLLSYNRHVREKHLGENQKWFHFVQVDFSEVRNKPLFEATKLMFLELVESLHERQLDEEYEAASRMFKDALSFQDELVLFQGLKKTIDFLAIEKELTIVFLLERFEEYIPVLTKDLFSNLRILRSHAKYRFSVVFSLGRPLEDMLEGTMLTDFYEFLAGHIVYVPLEDSVVATFRLQYLEKVTGQTMAKEYQKDVLALTGGHGKLTRLCYEALFAENGQSSVVTGQLSRFFLSKKPILGALYELWYFLTPQEQKEIAQLVFSGKKGESPFLKEINLLEQGSLTIPLLAGFLKENPSLQKSEKMIFDELTHTIKKGEANVSDLLTASEFRLLAYLLEHKEEVISREEIIQAVWRETATTMGVSDQAVDQLVFRLRKKIEEDPNNPLHILTVKGRGIKFSE